MNDLREQLADVIEVAIDNAHDMDVTHRDYANASADAIIAALPGMVQPLVWEGIGESRTARSPIGDYLAEKDAPYGWGFWPPCHDIDYDPCGGHHASMDEAKAAAQAHHVATIMKALGIEND